MPARVAALRISARRSVVEPYMQSNLVPTEVIQPFLKLVQANMELWSNVWLSPELMSEATRNMKGLMEQSQASM
jgi:hypothetical protein